MVKFKARQKASIFLLEISIVQVTYTCIFITTLYEWLSGPFVDPYSCYSVEIVQRNHVIVYIFLMYGLTFALKQRFSAINILLPKIVRKHVTSSVDLRSLRKLYTTSCDILIAMNEVFGMVYLCLFLNVLSSFLIFIDKSVSAKFINIAWLLTVLVSVKFGLKRLLHMGNF